MTCLILLEHDGKKIAETSFHVLTAALALSQEIDLLIIGYQCEAIITQAKSIPSIRQILVCDHANFKNITAENAARLIFDKLANHYEYILSAANTFGKNILPRLAGLLSIDMLSDVITIIDANTFERPIYAGNVVQTVQLTGEKKILTVRASAFAAMHLTNSTTSTPIQSLEFDAFTQITTFVDVCLSKSSRPEITSAKVIVSGGRGLKNAENFGLLNTLADKLQAAVGATRAAVDANFVPNDYQIGQTGKIVAPEVYLAIGISGAIQHLAGMKDSRMVIAINCDPEAPIFKAADYYLVGDLFQILPTLMPLL